MVTQLPPAACTSVKCSSSLIWLAGPSCSCHSCPSCHWPCLGSYKLIFTLGTVRLRSFLNISSIIKSDLTCWISTIVISNIQNFHCSVIIVYNYLSTILNNLSIKSIQNIRLSHICLRYVADDKPWDCLYFNKSTKLSSSCCICYLTNLFISHYLILLIPTSSIQKLLVIQIESLVIFTVSYFVVWSILLSNRKVLAVNFRMYNAIYVLLEEC